MPPTDEEILIKAIEGGMECLGVVHYLDDTHCIWRWAHEERTIHTMTKQMTFRPLPTPEEVEREAVISEAYTITGYTSSDGPMAPDAVEKAVNDLYDAGYLCKPMSRSEAHGKLKRHISSRDSLRELIADEILDALNIKD